MCVAVRRLEYESLLIMSAHAFHHISSFYTLLQLLYPGRWRNSHVLARYETVFRKKTLARYAFAPLPFYQELPPVRKAFQEEFGEHIFGQTRQNLSMYGPTVRCFTLRPPPNYLQS